jgi:hypothetical protein
MTKPHTPEPVALLEVIDADLARMMLTMNRPHEAGVAGTNRKVRQAQVDKIAGDILAGDWILNNQAIGIGSDDVLVDGQHRLLALLKAAETDPEVTIESWVMWNLNPKAMTTVDIGKNRVGKDFLAMIGVANGSQIASALRLVYAYDTIQPYSYQAWKRAQFSATKLQELAVEHADLVNNYYTGHGAARLLTPASVAAGLYLIRRDRPDLVELLPRFLEPLKTGENLVKGSPILALREWAKNALSQKRRRDGVTMLVLFLRAFNHWVEDNKIKSMRFSEDEPFAGLTKKEFYQR